jgi:hypothetical protein
MGGEPKLPENQTECFIMPGEKEAEENGAVSAADGSRKTRSVKAGGLSMKSEAQPDELLAILADHLKRINSVGIEVEMIPTVTRKGRLCVGFLVTGVQVVEGRMRVVPETLPEK